MSKLLTGVAIASLFAAVPALAQDAWKEKQRDQLLYQEQLRMQNQDQAAGGQQGPIGQVKPNSGPGVQGPPDTRTGPSTRAPGGSSEGASTGESGSAASGASSNKTQPSQDSSGVQGFPDTRTGPSTKEPDDQGGADKE
jgi:hypothetical protein